MTGPFDHPFLGGLFGDRDAAQIWNPERQITHMLAFEAAYTRALGRVGKLDAVTAEKTAQQIETSEPDMFALNSGTASDGVVVPALVAQLKGAIGGDPASIHEGTTSQDVIDTALALTLRDFNDLLGVKLEELCGAFDRLEVQFGTRTIIGRTRMQAAIPITLAGRLSTWAYPVERHRQRLARLRPAVERLQLGSAAGDRAALAPHADEIARSMADQLGLQNPELVWHAIRDDLADYANLLSLMTGSLGKFGQDICLMAQQGIDEVTLAGGGSSSAMPHKQNPILAELLVTLARFNATQVAGMHHALVHEQERSGSAWALEWMILPQMAQATARSLAAATEICGKITSIGTA
ncbi:3-carboxy-cis,cis-muconate cycloisomerase [Litoreibacter janthinus]|uniref:3-carboxy-cis,cis-muconate cycloisomerase n=1 Tax=Litoreibacter janthinus TaxID=670154 RepID=A0A1I6GSX4_9RHOB|nr:3-carboxy-cis,cis-muconate cycloisomerase [Litoreibacter janthinus]SFR45345.1 3-carboxy-cis,cis-muconate cycloisomerase [Litoreibacter janthinus]